MKRLWMVGLVVGCGGNSSSGGVDSATGDTAVATDAAPDVAIDAALMLNPTPGTYRRTCDGSGGVAIDFEHFLDINDENQGARIYKRATDGLPVQTIELSAGLGLATNDEADLEDVARVGDRIFVTASHGRTTSGSLDRARYRFAALDVTGAVPNVALTVAGSSSLLLDQMLVAGNWDAPNTGVIAALAASSDLGDNSDPDLAPEIDGTNIEGLASNNAGALLIGFRNPRPGNKAIVVSLTNPNAVITGQTARFAGAAELDLGGLAIRSMTWSPSHSAVLIVAGPHDGGGPFELYRWSGALNAQPMLITALVAPAQSSPEALVVYPSTLDVQLLYDMGDTDVNGELCKVAPLADQVFSDVIVHVD